jgi:hypothetical protein
MDSAHGGLMIIIDAILEALSYAGLLSGDLVPEEWEDR